MNRTEALEQQEAENAKYFARMDIGAKSSAAERDFYQAAKHARMTMQSDGLEPLWIDDKWVRTDEQTAKAAAYTREGMVAVANLQLTILKRLDRNRGYMWVVIALLGYIAYQIK